MNDPERIGDDGLARVSGSHASLVGVGSAANDVAYGILRQAKQPREFNLRDSGKGDFANDGRLLVRQLGVMRELPAHSGAVKPFVGFVFNLRHPRQIVGGSIRYIAIQMSAAEPCRARSDKRLQHDQMDSLNLAKPRRPKGNTRIAASEIRAEQTRTDATHVARIGDFVSAFKTNNGEPFFHA